MKEALDAYFQFLWSQFQYDWSVFSNPWILFTIIPAILYFCFFWIKWYILLIPITLPLSMFVKGEKKQEDRNNYEEIFRNWLKKN